MRTIKHKSMLALLLAATISLPMVMESMAETTADLAGIEVYGGDLSAKNYKGIDFSVENLGVSAMALGSIINPSSNTTTAEQILQKKLFYDNGTDASFMSQEQNAAVEAFLGQWKAEHITDGMTDEEKFKAIFDYMTSTVTYDKNAANPQSSYGALIERRCVCGGYANGFLKMAKACGLDAKFLILSNHAINLVQVSGKWYATDVTQNIYNNSSTTGVYYMHTTPELDSSVEEKVAKLNERNQNKGQTINGENEKYQEKVNEAFAAQAIFHMNQENLIPSLLDYVENKIDAGQFNQKIYMILYTDGRDFTEFHRTRYDYNGTQERIHKIIAGKLKGQTIGGKIIKQTSSCNIRYRKELGEDGMDTFARLWTDEAGQTFVLLDCNIYLE